MSRQSRYAVNIYFGPVAQVPLNVMPDRAVSKTRSLWHNRAMCNLYSNKSPHDEMQMVFEVTPEHAALGNMPALSAIYPKYEAPIVAIGKEGHRSLVRAQWGFLTPNKSKKTGAWLKPSAWNNTRDDKIRSSGLWKQSFETRRCIVPATAYAEATGRNPATYHWFDQDGQDVFGMAGIWRYQKGTIGDTEFDGVVYSIVTTNANAVASDYHTRMPVILAKQDYEQWLRASPDDAASLIVPSPPELLRLRGSGIGLKEEPPRAASKVL